MGAKSISESGSSRSYKPRERTGGRQSSLGGGGTVNPAVAESGLMFVLSALAAGNPAFAALAALYNNREIIVELIHLAVEKDPAKLERHNKELQRLIIQKATSKLISTATQVETDAADKVMQQTGGYEKIAETVANATNSTYTPADVETVQSLFKAIAPHVFEKVNEKIVESATNESKKSS